MLASGGGTNRSLYCIGQHDRNASGMMAYYTIQGTYFMHKIGMQSLGYRV